MRLPILVVNIDFITLGANPSSICHLNLLIRYDLHWPYRIFVGRVTSVWCCSHVEMGFYDREKLFIFNIRHDLP